MQVRSTNALSSCAEGHSSQTLSKRAMQLIAVLSISFMLAFMLGGCSEAATHDEPAASSGAGEAVASASEDTITVSLSISCKDAVDAGNETALAVSEDGVIFEGELELEEGSTLEDALDAAGVDITVVEGTYGKYISAINGLAEKSVGDTSGWTYLVNDEWAEESYDKQVLKDGDTVQFSFILSYE